jgi:hypothetical protein
MSIDTVVRGVTSGTGTDVDANKQLLVATNTDPLKAGASVLYHQNDGGSATGTRLLRSPQVSQDYRARVGMDTLLFTDTFNATAQNTNLWNYVLVTLTATQPGGYLQFGTVQGTASTHGAFMKTFQYFPLIGTAPLLAKFTLMPVTAVLVANEAMYWGFGAPTVAGTVPTDGVWFKATSAGVIGEVVYNGVTTPTATLTATFTGLATNRIWALVVGERSVEFWCDDVLQATVTVPAANGQPWMAASQPVFLQKLCTGVVSNTNVVRVSDVTVTLLDLASNKPWPAQMSTQGMHGSQGQNGQTQGKTALWGNSAAPTAAALVNNAAAFTGLGGIVAVLPTFTVGSDGLLINYTNPAATINITGRNLLIYGVTIQGGVSVIFTGGPVTNAFALVYGHITATLAATETASFATATTHMPRVVALGMDTYPATAAVGTLGNAIRAQFTVPIVVRPGEMVGILVRNVGVVTSSTSAITYVVGFDSCWE